MQRFLTAAAALILAAAPAFAQVDTLRLVEINSIEMPDEITHLYTASLFNENKEIFICTDNAIYVCDGETGNPIWVLDVLSNPEDLLFENMNNDGFTDLIFRDEYNIRIYDILNDEHTWSSPTLDSTYKCYTVGDRNDDGWIDVAVVSKEIFSRPQVDGNLDTVLIDIYDGPSFDFPNESIVLMQNVYYYEPTIGLFRYYEWPEMIQIVNLYDIDNSERFIILNASIYTSSASSSASSETIYGQVWLLDASNFEFQNSFHSGDVFYSEITIINNAAHLTTVGEYLSTWNVDFVGRGGIRKIPLLDISHDLTVDSTEVFADDWDGDDPEAIWKDCCIDNFNDENPGKEICFGADDHINLYSFPSLDYIWLNSGAIDSIFTPYFSNTFFDDVQILVYNENNQTRFDFYSGSDGSLTAALLNQDIELDCVTDLNADGNDEILSIDGNILRIYNLEYYIDIDQPATVPYHTFIQPNYPNPFNAATTIEYGLKQDSRVTIDIYDLLGRRVETLIDETKPAGLYQTTWHAEDIPSGVYFYKIQAGDYSKTRKMMLLK